MATFTINFFSNCLCRPVQFTMYAPVEQKNNPAQAENPCYKRPMKTLFLLHGYMGDGGNWVPTYLSDKYNFAVVCPNGENGFWIDGMSTGHAFGSFLGKELLGFIRDTFGFAMKREDTYVMGLSMGGFGALHTGLAYPEDFGTIAALSSALIVHGVSEMQEGKGNSVANYEYYRECFGEPSKVLESDNNPEVLVKKIKAGGKQMPTIYMRCGYDDFLRKDNIVFHEFLEAEGVEHSYEESEGTHDMEFWSKCVNELVPVMFG